MILREDLKIMLSEKAKSRAQQRFFGMVRSAQKGEMKNPSSEVTQTASSMSKSDVKKMASTKHKGLPEIKEGKKRGLWDNIHAKRKRGEPPAKKGDKDYPKTLNVEAKVEHIGEMPSASNLKFGIPKGLPGLGGGGGGTDAISAKSKSKTLGKTVKDAGKLATTPFRALLGIKSKQDPREKFASEAKSAAWQRKEGKNKKGGLNEKGRKSYERENPGSDLKAPQPGGGPRKRSFCARMSGVKGPMKDEKGRPTRKALALRKWKC